MEVPSRQVELTATGRCRERGSGLLGTFLFRSIGVPSVAGSKGSAFTVAALSTFPIRAVLGKEQLLIGHGVNG